MIEYTEPSNNDVWCCPESVQQYIDNLQQHIEELEAALLNIYATYHSVRQGTCLPQHLIRAVATNTPKDIRAALQEKPE